MRLFLPLLLPLFALPAAAVEVSVCRDATYDISVSATSLCAGSGARPVGYNCPKTGDLAVADCNPQLPSYNKGHCVVPEDAVCQIVNGDTWGCVLPSVGCNQVVQPKCSTWTFNGEDPVDLDGSGSFDGNEDFDESWFVQTSPLRNLNECPSPPTPAPTIPAPTPAPTTPAPTPAPTTPAPTPAPTTLAPTPAPTTPAPTPAPTTPAPTPAATIPAPTPASTTPAPTPAATIPTPTPAATMATPVPTPAATPASTTPTPTNSSTSNSGSSDNQVGDSSDTQVGDNDVDSTTVSLAAAVPIGSVGITVGTVIAIAMAAAVVAVGAVASLYYKKRQQNQPRERASSLEYEMALTPPNANTFDRGVTSPIA